MRLKADDVDAGFAIFSSHDWNVDWKLQDFGCGNTW